VEAPALALNARSPDIRTMMMRPLAVLTALVPNLMLAQPAPTNKAQTHLDKARTAYKADELAIALVYADSAIAADQTVPGGYKLRGDIKQRQKNLHGALADYTKAEKYTPDDARLYVSRSAVYISEGRVKEAIGDADKALKLDPKDSDAWYNRACANYVGRNNDAALRELDKALELAPTHANALFLRGVVKGELYKESAGLADIEAALALDPKLAGAAMSAGVLLFETKRYAEAIERFNEVIAEGGSDLKEAHYYRADCYYQLADKDKACTDWRRAGELGDKDAQFIVRNYCSTDADKIPKKPVRERKTVIEF
jgi:tetratricopeptide (TPR) repeat protein